jgi:hypothetical protein
VVYFVFSDGPGGRLARCLGEKIFLRTDGIRNEKNIAVRAIGTLLMVAGAVVITIWGG